MRPYQQSSSNFRSHEKDISNQQGQNNEKARKRNNIQRNPDVFTSIEYVPKHPKEEELRAQPHGHIQADVANKSSHKNYQQQTNQKPIFQNASATNAKKRPQAQSREDKMLVSEPITGQSMPFPSNTSLVGANIKETFGIANPITHAFGNQEGVRSNRGPENSVQQFKMTQKTQVQLPGRGQLNFTANEKRKQETNKNSVFQDNSKNNAYMMAQIPFRDSISAPQEMANRQFVPFPNMNQMLGFASPITYAPGTQERPGSDRSLNNSNQQFQMREEYRIQSFKQGPNNAGDQFSYGQYKPPSFQDTSVMNDNQGLHIQSRDAVLMPGVFPGQSQHFPGSQGIIGCNRGPNNFLQRFRLSKQEQFNVVANEQYKQEANENPVFQDTSANNTYMRAHIPFRDPILAPPEMAGGQFMPFANTNQMFGAGAGLMPYAPEIQERPTSNKSLNNSNQQFQRREEYGTRSFNQGPNNVADYFSYGQYKQQTFQDTSVMNDNQGLHIQPRDSVLMPRVFPEQFQHFPRSQGIIGSNGGSNNFLQQSPEMASRQFIPFPNTNETFGIAGLMPVSQEFLTNNRSLNNPTQQLQFQSFQQGLPNDIDSKHAQKLKQRPIQTETLYRNAPKGRKTQAEGQLRQTLTEDEIAEMTGALLCAANAIEIDDAKQAVSYTSENIVKEEENIIAVPVPLQPMQQDSYTIWLNGVITERNNTLDLISIDFRLIYISNPLYKDLYIQLKELWEDVYLAYENEEEAYQCFLRSKPFFFTHTSNSDYLPMLFLILIELKHCGLAINLSTTQNLLHFGDFRCRHFIQSAVRVILQAPNVDNPTEKKPFEKVKLSDLGRKIQDIITIAQVHRSLGKVVVSAAFHKIGAENKIAIHYEKNWFEQGKASLIQIATKNEVFILDLEKLCLFKEMTIFLINFFTELLSNKNRIIILMDACTLIEDIILSLISQSGKESDKFVEGKSDLCRVLDRNKYRFIDLSQITNTKNIRKLMQNTLEVSLGEYQRFNNWSHRPLSKDQIYLAAMDVCGLYACYERLFEDDEDEVGI